MIFSCTSFTMETKNTHVSDFMVEEQTGSSDTQSIPDQLPPTPIQVDMAAPINVEECSGGGFGDGSADQETVPIRKRGRPKKCVSVSSDVPPVLSPLLLPVSLSSFPVSEPCLKRGRGRPRGSGRMQFLASAAAGAWAIETAGACFTPHVLEVGAGQDIGDEISTFAQYPRATTVLSATGRVSNVTLGQHAGGFVKYYGDFDIVSLSGTYNFGQVDGMQPIKNGFLSVILSHPDGRLFGGPVTGSLIALTSIQLVIATFKQQIGKKQLPIIKEGESSRDASRGDGGLSAMALEPILINKDSAVNPTATLISEPVPVEAGPIPEQHQPAPRIAKAAPLQIFHQQINSVSSLPVAPQIAVASPLSLNT